MSRFDEKTLTEYNHGNTLPGMKTAISIPDDIFRTADSFARRTKMSRSAIFTVAVTEFLSHHSRKAVTERLNKVYGKESSSLDDALAKLQSATLVKEKW